MGLHFVAFFADLAKVVKLLKFLCYLQPVKKQPSENKKVKKFKEKKKQADTVAINGSNASPPQGDDGLTPEELVMAATGCKVQNN